jgi:hypothetical protein
MPPYQSGRAVAQEYQLTTLHDKMGFVVDSLAAFVISAFIPVNVDDGVPR